MAWKGESRRHANAQLSNKRKMFTDNALQSETVEHLDPLEERFFLQQYKNTGGNVDKALEVVVNTVEGDESQLSPHLLVYARKKGWLESYR